MLNRPNRSARVTAPMPGRAVSTTPNAIEISPVTIYIARVPAVSPLPKAAKISAKPATNAQIATTSTSTSAVGPGQTRATAPAARSISASSRWPKTGPAVRLMKARADERVDREQDDQRSDRHARPDDGDDPDDDAQNPKQDQRGGC